MNITMEQVQVFGILFGLFYILPTLICYLTGKLTGEKIDLVLCIMPGFNCFATIFCLGIICEHFFPSPPNPVQEALKKLKEEMENGEYGRQERIPVYIRDFIEQKGLRTELDDYIDAMELARKMQRPEEK